jgi:hypothetical protein
MFSTKGVVLKSEGGFKYLSYGVQKAVIVGYELKTAKTGKQMVVLLMEGPKVTDAGFEPDPASKFGGRIGRVNFTIYFDKDNKEQMEQFITNIALIAKKLGVSEQVDVIEASDLESYLNKLMPVLRGKFAVWAITAQEYVYNKDGKDKVGYSLGLRRYGFIASLDEVEADPNHIKPFNKDDKYDYQAVAIASVDPDFKVQAPEDEMPW